MAEANTDVSKGRQSSSGIKAVVEYTWDFCWLMELCCCVVCGRKRDDAGIFFPQPSK